MTDLTVPAGQVLTATVSQTSVGALYLHSFSSSTTAYPTASLRACVEYTGGTPCTPVAVPDPAYWQVGSADLARHTSYQIRVVSTVGSSALLGLHLGWDGAHRMSVAGVDLPGGCTYSSGYRPGCGVRFHFTTPTSGPVTFATAATGLHLTVKDKTTATKVFSGTVSGSATFTMPGGDECSARLWPDNGASHPNMSFDVRWS